MPFSICFGIVTLYFVLLFLLRFRNGGDYLFPGVCALLYGAITIVSVGFYAEGALSVFFYVLSGVFGIGCAVLLSILVIDRV